VEELVPGIELRGKNEFEGESLFWSIVLLEFEFCDWDCDMAIPQFLAVGVMIKSSHNLGVGVRRLSILGVLGVTGEVVTTNKLSLRNFLVISTIAAFIHRGESKTHLLIRYHSVRQFLSMTRYPP
jgi:hypothetical protein